MAAGGYPQQNLGTMPSLMHGPLGSVAGVQQPIPSGHFGLLQPPGQFQAPLHPMAGAPGGFVPAVLGLSQHDQPLICSRRLHQSCWRLDRERQRTIFIEPQGHWQFRLRQFLADLHHHCCVHTSWTVTGFLAVNNCEVECLAWMHLMSGPPCETFQSTGQWSWLAPMTMTSCNTTCVHFRHAYGSPTCVPTHLQ